MARLGVLASGSGTNFQKIVERLRDTGHETALLICDRKDAVVFQRAKNLGVPSLHIPYRTGAPRQEAEAEITARLENARVDLVALAGFMRILTPFFVRRWRERLVNIHPALLPRHPGAHGIADSFASTDSELGVSVHWVDEGVDTGEIIGQRSFLRTADLSLEEAERRIHELEYQLYPEIVKDLLDRIDKEK